MKKKYLPLTIDPKQRGVIFSSELVGGGIIHEVFITESEEEINKKILRLLDDKFFDNSPYKYNLIRK